VDGGIIEFCDKFAAYMEAYLSIKHGITSKNLVDGHRDLYNRFARTNIAGIDAGVLFDYFRLE
jgi:putative hydrolase of HD superfamily